MLPGQGPQGIAEQRELAWVNVTPGTVIDREITTTSAFDFYLVSHYGLKV